MTTLAAVTYWSSASTVPPSSAHAEMFFENQIRELSENILI